MNKRPHPVSVTILGKDYKIACSENEKEALISSAKDLDKQMREIRDTGIVTSPDRIAVMAALNLTHELSQAQGQLPSQGLNSSPGPTGSIANKLIKLRHKIENVLENS